MNVLTCESHFSLVFLLHQNCHCDAPFSFNTKHVHELESTEFREAFFLKLHLNNICVVIRAVFKETSDFRFRKAGFKMSVGNLFVTL